MSKLFGWFSKNKHTDKSTKDEQPAQSTTEQAESLPEDLQQARDIPASQEPVEETHADEATRESEPQTATPTREDDQATESDVTVAPAEPADTPAVAQGSVVEEDEVPAPAETPAVTRTESVTPADAEVTAEPVAPAPEEEVVPAAEPAEQPPTENKKPSLFGRLKASLSRTKANLGSGFVSLFKGKAIDDELYEDLETQLLVADVGMDTTQKIIRQLTDSAHRKQLKDAEALVEILKGQMGEMLQQVDQPLPDVMNEHDSQEGPFVILMVGVNGVGKTTTIGKLAKQFQQDGKRVMLAAGDTFRAAAVEQLQVWGERNSIPVIAQPTGSDSASVLYDALEAAKSRKMDVLIADTAGRLQNKNNLMEELKKVVRVMKKVNPNAPHEVMLTLDAGTGQNAVSQAKLFNEAVGLTGITLTKLDGTAKGGVIFSIADKFGIPIRYIGVGESIDDLRTFDSAQFIDALFSESDKDQ
ncbi:signal recognition particle-docking protein FtsY [Alteromonas sp. ASW11-19]|uniref:Signal recognition particle receptor FtsY n=1 Tax=Alteromonas salexigens TaxID=2982530 RepID=A0ABT2VMJ5_9ALTE|nr:signal recognition particle-docking protein FtsY [Alteromonas salexigens]MCU7554538.1 signal recognition particle-docking protein FtsY [Alteromonas salexigens]